MFAAGQGQCNEWRRRRDHYYVVAASRDKSGVFSDVVDALDRVVDGRDQASAKPSLTFCGGSEDEAGAAGNGANRSYCKTSMKLTQAR